MKPFSSRKNQRSEGKPRAPTTISNTTDFFRFLDACVHSSDNALYRGLRRVSYPLIPSIGRFKQKGRNPFTPERERLMLKLFRQKTYGLIEAGHSDLALLTIAQHHGMPTRLMDWTRNALVAFYFAVRDDFHSGEKLEDSAVYFYHPPEKVVLDQEFDPFAIRDERRFIPKYWSPRIAAQNGLFTIHYNPQEPFKPSGLQRVRIKHGQRRNIKMALNNLGVNSASLFPDVDGIASHVAWLRTDMY